MPRLSVWLSASMTGLSARHQPPSDPNYLEATTRMVILRFVKKDRHVRGIVGWGEADLYLLGTCSVARFQVRYHWGRCTVRPL
ncbi:hypothetical protein EV702DRAFT_291808 [Suillus placidus]|uniref:Uncharacterized protein n=1 Tax=Suillus placidus TaxID=48579 RepID=A0A9P7D1Y6_9AGAM|nr:hypothetical protein EV702DRAFT_291808 [Suillus placidus]